KTKNNNTIDLAMGGRRMQRIVDARGAKQWLKGDGLRGAVMALALVATADGASAAPPASNEIRIGATSPITGPTPAYSVQAKVISAYFDKVNAEGGINGRKINMIIHDDGYDPKRSLEMTRKLVEEDQVLFTMGTVGTATNAATSAYLNSK